VSMDPFANSFAGGHYAIGRYGSLAAVDPRRRPMGYDKGGWLRPGLSPPLWNGTGRSEPIGFDYDKLADKQATATARALEGMVVVLDGQQVGRLVVDPLARRLHRLVQPGSARA